MTNIVANNAFNNNKQM